MSPLRFKRKKPSRVEGRLVVTNSSVWRVGTLVQASDVLMKVRRVERCERGTCALVVTEVGPWERKFYALRMWLRWLLGL